jgi:muramidase (phage lysozyme)
LLGRLFAVVHSKCWHYSKKGEKCVYYALYGGGKFTDLSVHPNIRGLAGHWSSLPGAAQSHITMDAAKKKFAQYQVQYANPSSN